MRVEFRPIATEPGPVVDLVFKLFPKGTASFPGLIIGLPTLDVPPYELGHRLGKDVHISDGLNGIRLPGLEIHARARLHGETGGQSMRVTRALDAEYKSVCYRFNAVRGRELNDDE